jgi:hypothetical protein
MSPKEEFLKKEFPSLLKELSDNEVGAWGVLTPQGMVEHMTDAVRNAYGRIKLPLQTKPELLERMRNFVLSDIPFKQNTKNALMTETPAPLVNKSLTEAIWELEKEIGHFMNFYKEHPGHKEMNPFFGELNYEEQVHLLHKHATHHLTQFNLL